MDVKWGAAAVGSALFRLLAPRGKRRLGAFAPFLTRKGNTGGSGRPQPVEESPRTAAPVTPRLPAALRARVPSPAPAPSRPGPSRKPPQPRHQRLWRAPFFPASPLAEPRGSDDSFRFQPTWHRGVNHSPAAWGGGVVPFYSERALFWDKSAVLDIRARLFRRRGWGGVLHITPFLRESEPPCEAEGVGQSSAF